MKKETLARPPACPLSTYTRQEKLAARSLIKTLTQNSASSNELNMNVIYISTATKREEAKLAAVSAGTEKVDSESSKYLASEVPRK